MTPEEAVILTRYVRAMYPNVKLDEFTPDAWHDALASYNLADARAAVVKHVRRGNAFISAGEIAAEVIRTRNARIEAARPFTGTGGEWPDEIAAMRRRNTALASGATGERPALPAGDEALDVTKKGIAMLRAVGVSGLSKRPELAAPCPHCAAAPGRSCTNGKGERRLDAHPTRIQASQRLNSGENPTSREEAEREMDRRRAASASAVAGLAGPVEPDDGFDPTHRIKPKESETS